MSRCGVWHFLGSLFCPFVSGLYFEPKELLSCTGRSTPQSNEKNEKNEKHLSLVPHSRGGAGLASGPNLDVRTEHQNWTIRHFMAAYLIQGGRISGFNGFGHISA